MTRDAVRAIQVRGKALSVDESLLSKVEAEIEGCEKCDTSSDTPFSVMLRFFIPDAPKKNHTLVRPVKCPRCEAVLADDTLVYWD